MAAEFLRLREEADKERKRVEELERLRKEEEATARRLETQRRSELETVAELWEKSRRLTTFISACETEWSKTGALKADDGGARWLAWAKDYAFSLDPLNGSFLAEQQRTF